MIRTCTLSCCCCCLLLLRLLHQRDCWRFVLSIHPIDCCAINCSVYICIRSTRLFTQQVPPAALAHEEQWDGTGRRNYKVQTGNLQMPRALCSIRGNNPDAACMCVRSIFPSICSKEKAQHGTAPQKHSKSNGKFEEAKQISPSRLR